MSEMDETADYTRFETVDFLKDSGAQGAWRGFVRLSAVPDSSSPSWCIFVYAGDFDDIPKACDGF